MVKKEKTLKWWGLAALTLAAVMIGLDMTILNIALPTLANTFNATTNQLQWFVNSYTLALAVCMLPAGLLGDRYGRKKLLIWALVLFSISSLLCAFAETSAFFIFARFILGVAAAFVITLSTSILPVVFSKDERSKAVSILMIGTMLSLPIGPLLGGWMLDSFWWGWIFLINVPVIALTIGAVLLFLPESRVEQHAKIDYFGILLSSVGLLSLTYGTIEAGAKGWSDWLVVGSLLLGVLLLLFFIGWQYKAHSPLIQMELFHGPVFRWSLVLAVLVNILLFGMLFVVPQYFQIVLQTDAFGSGLRLLTMIIGLVIGGGLAEILVKKFGEKKIIIIGFFFIVISTASGAMTTLESTEWFVGGWLTIFGLGMGFAMPTVMDLALGVLPPQQSGMGSSVIQTARQVGGALGIAILGSILNAGYRSHLPLNQFPEEAKSSIRDSVAGGLAIIEKMQVPQLLKPIYQSFISGMGYMLWSCFAVAVAGLLLAVFCLPGLQVKQNRQN